LDAFSSLISSDCVAYSKSKWEISLAYLREFYGVMATTPSIRGREPSSKPEDDTKFSVDYVNYLDSVKAHGLRLLDIFFVSCLLSVVE